MINGRVVRGWTADGSVSWVRRWPAILLVLLFVFAAPGASFGQTIWNNLGFGDWNTAGNWTLGVPNSASGTAFDAVIDNGGTAVLVPSGASVRRLRVGKVFGSGNLQVSGGGLTVTEDLFLNEFGVGIANMRVQVGGTVTVPAVVVGHSGTGSSNFTITGGSSVNATTSFVVGRAVRGNLFLNYGGTLSIGNGTQPLQVATLPGSTGYVFFGDDDGLGAPAGVLQASAVQFGAGSGSIIFRHTDNLTFATPITGPGFLDKLGPGTTTLSGANSYTGGTYVAFGTLAISADANLGTAPVSFNPNQLQIGQGTLRATQSFTMAANRGVSFLSTGGTIEVDATKTLTYPNNLTLSTGTTMTKIGAGTLSLQDLTIGPSGIVNLSGGTLRFNGYLNDGTINLNSGTIQLVGNRSVGTDAAIADLFGAIPTITTGKGLTVEGTATIQTTLTLDGGTLSVGSLINNGTFNFNAGTLAINQAGASINTPIVTGNLSTINLNANNISLGVASSFSGFDHQGVLNVGANTVTLNSAGYARLGVFTSLAGGAINAPNGVVFASGSNFRGRGAVNARVSGDAGSVIEADGALTLGDAASPAGFNVGGELRTRQHTVTLRSSAQAGLGNLTTLGSGASAGTLVAANGLVVDFNEAITGFGTVSSTNTLAKRSIVNGIAQGNSMAQPLTFSGYVKGVGTFNNVSFSGTFSPGLSTSILTVGNIALAPTSTLVIELGGTAPGSGYDQIQSNGALALNGALDVSLINGFAPSAGQSFNILDWGSVAGTFSAINLPSLPGLNWNTAQLYTTGMLSVTGLASLPGDFNLDGSINAVDIDLLAADAARAVSLDLDLYDLNDDGSVTFAVGPAGSLTSSDSDVLIRNILDTEYGDLNLDGTVFLGDLNTFATNYRQAGLFGWAQGNVNGSQEVGTAASPRVFLADLNALATNWRFGVGSGAALAVIPEPSSVLLASWIVFVALGRRPRS